MISVLNSKQYKNFTFATVSNFFFFCNFSAFFLLPLYIKELGGSEATIGYVMGSFGIASFGIIPLVSYLIDKYGRKSFILFGALLLCVSSLCFILVDDIGVSMFVLRILQGAGFAFFFTSVSTFVSDTVPGSVRAHGLGIFGAFTIASYAIGPSIGEFVINRCGFDCFFIYASGFSLIALVLMLFTTESEFKISSDRFGIGFIRLFTSRRYRFILLINLVIAGGLGVMLNFFADFLNTRGFRPSYFFVTYTIAVTMVRIFGGKLPDRYGRRTVALPCLFILAGSLIMISLIDSILMVFVVSFLFSIGYGMLYPAISSIVIDRANDDERGKAMGAFNSTFSLGINFLAFPFGYIAGRFGYETMYMIAGLFVLAAFLLFTYAETAARKNYPGVMNEN